MELVKKQVQMERKKGTASTQATFDEVYNLPDYLPDIYSVILNRGDVRLDESKTGPGHVMVRGAVKFKVLYRTDQNDWKVSSLEGEIPFQETLTVENMDEFDMVSVEPLLEDLSIQIINSRKLNIRALLELYVIAAERYDTDIPVSVETGDQPEILMSEMDFLELKYRGNEHCHIREEIKVPSNKPNIRQILWQQAQIFGMDSRISAGELTIQGEIQVFLVYVSEENNSLQWFVVKVPYQCVFEIPEADVSMIPYVAARPQNLICSVGNDEDGEPRMILVEADINADVRFFEEQRQEFIQDTYALDRCLILKKDPESFVRLRMKNESKCRVNDTLKIQNTDSDILQICAGFGTAEIDRHKTTDNGIEVEGAVHIQILYLTNNDNTPIEAVEGVLPFQYTIEIPRINLGDQVELQHSLEVLSFLMKSSREVEIQAVVNLQALVTEPYDMEVIREIKEEGVRIEQLNVQPSIVGLTLDQEDTLWDIAKQYNTTIDYIKQINQMEDEKISQGMKILLIKQLPHRAY